MIDRNTKKSQNPDGGGLVASQLLSLMSVYSETMYCATWIDGVEIELWDYFSQNTDPALLDPMIREEYEAIKSAAHHADGWWSHDGERYRFYPREEWVARTGQSWPTTEVVE